jgi:hypothetical protein
MLDNAVTKGMAAKKMSPAGRLKATAHLAQTFGVSQRRRAARSVWIAARFATAAGGRTTDLSVPGCARWLLYADASATGASTFCFTVKV